MPGPSGVMALRSASSTGLANIDTEELKTIQQLGDASSEWLTLSEKAQIVATASLSARGLIRGTGYYVCSLQIADANTPSEWLSFTRPYEESWYRPPAGTAGDAFGYTSIALVGSVERPAGTYNIRLACSTSLGLAPANVTAADLVAWAAVVR